MKRIYRKNGRGISTRIKGFDGRKYLVSTAEDKVHRVWQVAVFEKRIITNIAKPVVVDNTKTFIGAEKLHLAVEELIQKYPREVWQFMLPGLGASYDYEAKKDDQKKQKVRHEKLLEAMQKAWTNHPK